MITSTEISSLSKIVGEERAVELVAKAGFDAFDFSLFPMWKWDFKNSVLLPNDHPLSGKDYLAFARKIKQIGLDNGIVCNQSHAPFPTKLVGRDLILRAIECTAEAGGKICIVHPDNYSSPEQNAEMYSELLPFAKQCGVKIATENMFNWDRLYGHPLPAACSSPKCFVDHLKAVDDPYFVACLDLGHAELFGCNTSAVEMIEAIGDKLEALHIHDNDKNHDNHQIIGAGVMDYPLIAKTLKKNGYKGCYTLESNAYLQANGYTDENVLDGMKKLRASLSVFE